MLSAGRGGREGLRAYAGCLVLLSFFLSLTAILFVLSFSLTSIFIHSLSIFHSFCFSFNSFSLSHSFSFSFSLSAFLLLLFTFAFHFREQRYLFIKTENVNKMMMITKINR